MRCLVTGTAGFIGFQVARRLLGDGHQVTGIDGMTPHYDVRLKERRHAVLERLAAFDPHCGMLEDAATLGRIAERAPPETVIHLAAQAGVRYSLENPRAYKIRAPILMPNIVGTFNVLELCRKIRPRHLVIASTSSVYGGNSELPYAESDKADHPLTLYAASKNSAETMALGRRA